MSRLLADGARAWRTSPGMVLALMLVPFFMCLAGVIAGLLGLEAYKWLIGEDRLAENLQVALWCASLILGIAIAGQHARRGSRWLFLLYTVLCLGMVFVIGEEISWGQRILGWTTPESFEQMNKQGETNVHNLRGVETTFKWLHLVVAAYGTFMPLIVAYSRDRLPSYPRALAALVPHYTLVPYFAICLVWRIYRNFFTTPIRYYFVIVKYGEIIETILALGFTLFLWFQYRLGKASPTRTTRGTAGSSANPA